MAEQFLTLMADLDDETQEHLSQWYGVLKKEGFTGTQTPGLPYHISLATFSLDQEQEAVEIMRKAAGAFSPVSVHISHLGIFAPGKVLFSAPDISADLAALHHACETNPAPKYPWIPHITMLIDEPETICSAVPVFLRCFHLLTGKITKLHLCAFWPMRDIASAALGKCQRQPTRLVGTDDTQSGAPLDGGNAIAASDER